MGKSTPAHRAGAPTARERWVHGGQGSISLEYQTYTSAHPFVSLVTGLVQLGNMKYDLNNIGSCD